MARLVLLIAWGLALTGPAFGERGRLLATGGIAHLDGGAGGGIVPMALLAGYASDDQYGGTVSATRTDVDDYRLNTFSAAFNWHNRIELSASRQVFNLGTLGRQVGTGALDLQVNTVGVKVRLAGDVLYTEMPQVSLGAVYRRHHDFDIPELVGAREDSGTDAYLAATKVFLAGWLEQRWLVNAAVRNSSANHAGLVGFGGDRESGRSTLLEGTLGWFASDALLIGTEYRQKPDNLTALDEDNWRDVFIAWFPDKQWSLAAAAVDLGDIGPLEDQRGVYLSLTGSF
ncbi:MAG: DUF3034 family protein [Alcanivoracaceae bacterium]|nr:DUF3034 family protein [Alcanivoracaceae bacterium]